MAQLPTAPQAPESGASAPGMGAAALAEGAALLALLERLAAEVLPEAFIVEAMRKAGRRSVLTILADTDAGIQIAECARLNRGLRERLEALDPAWEGTEIEVSSPGVGAPLRLPRQFAANVGRTLELTLTDGRKLEGKLTEAQADAITLTRSQKNPTTRKAETLTEQLALASIKLARVKVSFR